MRGEVTKREWSEFDEWRTSTHREIKEQYTRTPKFAGLLATARKQMRPEALEIDKRGYDYIGDILEDATETLILRPDPTVVDYNVRGGNLPTDVSVEIVPDTSHTIFRDNQSDFVRLLDGFVSRHI